MAKVKVIELSGKKLDPNAVYLMAVNLEQVSTEDATFAYKELVKLGILKCILMGVKGDVNTAINFFEIPTGKANSSKPVEKRSKNK